MQSAELPEPTSKCGVRNAECGTAGTDERMRSAECRVRNCRNRQANAEQMRRAECRVQNAEFYNCIRFPRSDRSVAYFSFASAERKLWSSNSRQAGIALPNRDRTSFKTRSLICKRSRAK